MNKYWKVCTYSIYAWVADVSEIKQVGATNEWDLWYKNKYINAIRNFGMKLTNGF